MQVERFRTSLLIATGLFAVWGIIGIFDVNDQPYSGYSTDGNNTIIQVRDGSPAARAGFRVGDYIREIGGLAVEDAAALARRPRPLVGETRTYVVERDDATVHLDLTYARLPGGVAAVTFAAILIGFCFLIFGLLPYLKVPNTRTLLLAVFGVCFGLSFFNGPYFTSYALRTVASTFVLLFVLAGFATLLHFTLEFPRRKALARNMLVLRSIYGVAGLVGLFLLYRGLFQPPATSTLNVVTGALVGLFVVSYFGLSLATIIHSCVKATSQERTAYGLNIVLAGTLIGFLPVLLNVIVRLVAPQVILPGRTYYFLTLGLIPIALAWAALKRERTAETRHPAAAVPDETPLPA